MIFLTFLAMAVFEYQAYRHRQAEESRTATAETLDTIVAEGRRVVAEEVAWNAIANNTSASDNVKPDLPTFTKDQFVDHAKVELDAIAAENNRQESKVRERSKVPTPTQDEILHPSLTVSNQQFVELAKLALVAIAVKQDEDNAAEPDPIPESDGKVKENPQKPQERQFGGMTKGFIN